MTSEGSGRERRDRSRASKPRRASGEDPEDHALSLKLSAILRHDAIKLGLKVGKGGRVLVSELLVVLQRKGCRRACLEALQRVKDFDDLHGKGRFSLVNDEEGVWWMWANQGHTFPVEDDVLLHLVHDPSEIPLVVHGTYVSKLDSILEKGLSRCERQHIHFAAGLPGDVKSGMRSNATVLIYVDVAKAMAAGISFYISDNGVILSRGKDGVVDKEFFERVERVRGSVREVVFRN